MTKIRRLFLAALMVLPVGVVGGQTLPSTQPAQQIVGEQVPSDDAVLKDFHSLGLVDGEVDIFRSACPVRDLGKKMATTQPTDAEIDAAVARMRRLRDLGIRTDISFLNPEAGADDDKSIQATVNLEQAAANEVGLNYVAFPISNAGANSLEEMSDQDVKNWLDRVTAAILKTPKAAGWFSIVRRGMTGRGW